LSGTSPVEDTGDDEAANEETNEGNEATYSQLERTDQPVAARSPVGEARPEHGYGAA
jgi:hypothetical protein